MSYFIVPLIGTGAAKDGFRPKYISALAIKRQTIDLADACLVYADTTPEIDAQILANPDAIGTTDLDSQIEDVASTLETIGLPSAAATPGITYRLLFRRLAGIAQFVQCLEGILGREGQFAKLQLKGGILDSQIGSLVASAKQRWLMAAAELGLNFDQFPPTMLVRDVLVALGLEYIQGHGLRLGGARL